jgi:hypothetical protein
MERCCWLSLFALAPTVFCPEGVGRWPYHWNVTKRLGTPVVKMWTKPEHPGGLKWPQEFKGLTGQACGQRDGCFLASHLKAHNSEATSIVGGRNDGHQVGAFRDVLIVELDGHLVVTCWNKKAPSFQRFWKGASGEASWFLARAEVYSKTSPSQKPQLMGWKRVTWPRLS